MKTRWMLLVVAALVGLAMVGSAYAAEEPKTTVGAKAVEVKAVDTAKVEATGTAKAKVELSEAAAKAVKDAFPKATVGGVKADEATGVKLFAAKLTDGDVKSTVTVAADGTITAVQTEIKIADVAEAAAKVITKAAEGAEIRTILKLETRAEAKDAKVTKLEKAKVTFEARLAKGTERGKLVVDADGKTVTELAWKAATPKASDMSEKGEKAPKATDTGAKAPDAAKATATAKATETK
jgi:hypothetical protein